MSLEGQLLGHKLRGARYSLEGQVFGRTDRTLTILSK